MRMIEPHIRELTNKILDDVIEAGECDFVVDVAAEVPLQVIAEMIGVPAGRPAQALRVEQPDDRVRGPGVHGERRRSA